MKIKNSRLGLFVRKIFDSLRLPQSPNCDDTCSIHPAARFSGVMANIRIGRRVKIGRGAHIHCHSNGCVEIEEGTAIGDFVEISTAVPGGSVRIGKNCSINPYAHIWGHGGCVIGERTLLAPFVMIIPFNHNFSSVIEPIGKQGLSMQGVNIGRDVWLGTGVCVMDGAVVGDGSVVGASSVVTKELPINSVSVGIPAKVIGYRGEK